MASQRILIISAVFPPEQVTSAYMNYDLAKALSKDFDVTVIRPKPTRPMEASSNEFGLHDSDFKIIQIESYTNPESNILGRLKEAISFSKNAVNYLRTHRGEYNLVYNDAWQLFGLYIIARACVRYRIPYLMPIQDIYPECFFTNKKYPVLLKKIAQQFLLCYDRYSQKHAYRIRTISEEMAKHLSQTRKVNRDKYIVVNNWQEDEAFLNIHPKEIKERIRFVYVGSINLHSNVDLIIRAYAKANLPNSELYIYGGGNQKENCLKLASNLNLDNVFFNLVSREQVPTIQAMADVLVLALPSGNGKYCLPSKLTSYLLSARPVLASVDLDSTTRKIIKESKCGLVVPPDDRDALAEGFKKFSVLTLNELHKMGGNGRDFSLNYLTKAVNLNVVVETIKQALQ